MSQVQLEFELGGTIPFQEQVLKPDLIPWKLQKKGNDVPRVPSHFYPLPIHTYHKIYPTWLINHSQIVKESFLYSGNPSYPEKINSSMDSNKASSTI